MSSSTKTGENSPIESNTLGREPGQNTNPSKATSIFQKIFKNFNFLPNLNWKWDKTTVIVVATGATIAIAIVVKKFLLPHFSLPTWEKL